jgi:4-hydroxythreonine-4-phosphate dehydrogenase
MLPLIGITLGDVTGIGPEVTLKALAQDSDPSFRYLLIGDVRSTRKLNEKLGTNLDLHEPSSLGAPRFRIHDPLNGALAEELETGSLEAARAAVAWLKDAAARCLKRELAGMVTAPVNKETIVRAGVKFVGQTELLSEIAGEKRTAMMLLGHDDRQRWLRVALATTHVPLKKVSEVLTREKILLAIEMAARACAELGLPQARVGVCGLNPHAGEGGQMGDEEIVTIAPAVEAARAKNLDVTGPISADSLFHYAFKGEFDAVVSMYHDQGLVPMKMVAFENGVNWTVGLPFIRTSPDHGTAYDIAGQGKANPSSMLAALGLARQLVRRGNPG